MSEFKKSVLFGTRCVLNAVFLVSWESDEQKLSQNRRERGGATEARQVRRVLQPEVIMSVTWCTDCQKGAWHVNMNKNMFPSNLDVWIFLFEHVLFSSLLVLIICYHCCVWCSFSCSSLFSSCLCVMFVCDCCRAMFVCDCCRVCPAMHLFGLNWQLQDTEAYGAFDTTPNTLLVSTDNGESTNTHTTGFY